MLINAECSEPALEELVSAFRFNDAVIRHMVMRMDRAFTEASFLAKGREDEDSSSDSSPRRGRDNDRDDSDDGIHPRVFRRDH